ncbi:MAG: HAMP domain-containing sensor histidine kinase [Eubacteriales bacterium]|nr:HAMP domain-containing sensor histidine kinase [Eubacteriales bacterium]
MIDSILLILLLLLLSFLMLKQYTDHQRLRDMILVLQSILDGQKKRQIFSQKDDELGRLAFEINRLAALYGTVQEQYEKERVTKKQLISNLSHDVRTPLVSVIGYLEAIVQNRISSNQKDDYINTAYQKAKQLKEQVNQLFEFVQSDANEMILSERKVDACEITRKTLIDFLPLIENEHIVLDTSIPDDEISILVDVNSFVRILQNLIKNTLTHGAKGKYLGVSITREAGNVCIDIADKGQGIAQEHLPFVFERLYKVDSARSRGGGIGLAVAKELSNKMNGSLEILRSIPGDTVFRITFPEAK